MVSNVLPDIEKLIKQEFPNISLRDSQKKAIEIAHFRDRYGFYFDTGTGKTRVACSIIYKDFKEHVGDRFWVVVTPKSVISSWIKECQNWNIPFYTTQKEYLKTKNLYFNLLKGMGKGFYLNHWKEEKRKVLLINPELFIRDKDINCCDGLIVDESSIMQDPYSQQTKKIMNLAATAQKIYLLSGNPSPNDPIYLWSQAFTIGAYKEGWYKWTKQFGIQDKYYRWHAKTNCIDSIMEIMKNYCWYLSKKEVLSLQEPQIIYTYFAPETQPQIVFDNIIKELLAKGGEDARIKNELIKLRTLASGFLYKNSEQNEDDFGKETESDFSVSIYDNKRLETFQDVFFSFGNKKIIVWYQFLYSKKKLKEFFLENNILFTENHIEFIQNNKIQVFLSHPKSCGRGVDGLQTVCSDMIFYELSFSYDEFYQAVSRLQRSGQENPVVINMLVNNSIIDQFQIRAIEKKGKFLDLIIQSFSTKGEQNV